jgi:hypothetical protein
LERCRLFSFLEVATVGMAMLDSEKEAVDRTLWTIAETARFFRVNEATIRNWMKVPGKLPAPKRLGAKWLFVANEIKAMAGV